MENKDVKHYLYSNQECDEMCMFQCTKGFEFHPECETNELNYILGVVSEKTGVSIEDIKGKRRKPNIVTARQLYYYFSKKRKHKNKETLESIGALVNRHHSTVLSFDVERFENHRFMNNYEIYCVREIGFKINNKFDNPLDAILRLRLEIIEKQKEIKKHYKLLVK